MQSLQQWNHPFVLAIWITELDDCPPTVLESELHDHVRLLMRSAAAVSKDVHQQRRALSPHRLRGVRSARILRVEIAVTIQPVDPVLRPREGRGRRVGW